MSVRKTAAGRGGEREFLSIHGFHPSEGERTCRCCGWTDDLGCEEESEWAAEDLCSQCAAENEALRGEEYPY